MNIDLNDQTSSEYIKNLIRHFEANEKQFDKFFMSSNFVVLVDAISGTISVHFEKPDPVTDLTYFTAFTPKSMTLEYKKIDDSSSQCDHKVQLLQIEYAKHTLKAIKTFVGKRYFFMCIFLDASADDEETARQKPLLRYP